MKLIGFAIYLGIGAMLHALFNGAHFDWSSAWTFGWLLGWPIMLFITFGAGIVLLVAAVALLCIIWSWLETIAQWREARRMRRAKS